MLGSRLRDALVHTYTKWGEGGGVELTKGRYVETKIYTKSRANEKSVSLTKFGKAQRVTGLLCAVLNVIRHSSKTFSLLTNLPY